MKRLNIDAGEGGIPHIVYDLSLPLPERVNKAMTFNSATEAAGWLGITPKKIYNNRTIGKRVQGINGKFYAVRILRDN